DLAARPRAVGIVSHLRRQIEGSGKPGLAGFEQIMKSFIGLLGRPETGVLTHRPETAAIHGRLHAACIWVKPRQSDALGRFGRRIERLDPDSARSLERALARRRFPVELEPLLQRG